MPQPQSQIHKNEHPQSKQTDIIKSKWKSTTWKPNTRSVRKNWIEKKERNSYCESQICGIKKSKKSRLQLQSLGFGLQNGYGEVEEEEEEVDGL